MSRHGAGGWSTHHQRKVQRQSPPTWSVQSDRGASGFRTIPFLPGGTGHCGRPPPRGGKEASTASTSHSPLVRGRRILPATPPVPGPIGLGYPKNWITTWNLPPGPAAPASARTLRLDRWPQRQRDLHRRSQRPRHDQRRRLRRRHPRPGREFPEGVGPCVRKTGPSHARGSSTQIQSWSSTHRYEWQQEATTKTPDELPRVYPTTQNA